VSDDNTAAAAANSHLQHLVQLSLDDYDNAESLVASAMLSTKMAVADCTLTYPGMATLEDDTWVNDAAMV